MPGASSSFKPLPASEPSNSDEASQLELYLQRQLEEDVARIFDESIYSDLELVCGKLKILTHSCILKARTNKFYHKLQAILHVNIGKNTFDEIYSFISDAYTECNIKNQEEDIITYLDENLNIIQSNPPTTIKTNEERGDEPDVYLTPKCNSPYIDKAFQKPISSSPSTDLTKEYYALVPIDSNLLEKELIEQDALSDAFQSIIKTQRNKPTSLSLTSSHSSKTVKHSISCDILNNCQPPKENNVKLSLKSDEQKVNGLTSQKLISKSNLEPTVSSNRDIVSSQEGVIDKEVEVSSALSPDSLVTDEPSSSSDYLSAAFNYSPGVSTACTSHLNVGDNVSRMENNVTSSDSGLENTGLLESMSSHKDVTLTDVSLTESTLHDLATDDINDSMSSSLADKNYQRFKRITTSTLSGSSDINGIFPNSSPQSKDATSCESSKEEKQRQNEEIVILESSSLSSEAGSWESVFPPKHAERQICEKLINSEREHSGVGDVGDRNIPVSNFKENFSPSLVTKSPFKSTSCFIDAASLVDEDDDTIKVQVDSKETTYKNTVSNVLPAPSEPVPCSTTKLDASPNDWSESNDNEDSLEQGDQKDPDSMQKDISPTIFEMTPITEDSLCTNAFEAAVHNEEENKIAKSCEHSDSTIDKEVSLSSNTVFVSNTPHNSIMSIKSSSLKQYESEDSESDATVVGRENHMNLKKNALKYNESSPIVSGGASIEDHLPQSGSYSGSPVTRRKIENIPIVSGAYIPETEESSHKKSPRPTNVSAWVVDMSCHPKSDVDKNASSVTRPGDRTCNNLINESKHNSNDNCNKSRSSIDSDSSEKSSHKFYIDLSSLPEPIPPKKNVSENINEKKNIFSMYIDLGDKNTVKEMPARLSSSLNLRKSTGGENKTIPKANQNKTCKDSSTEGIPAQFPMMSNANQSICTFEKYESLCNDPNVSIMEIIKIPQECSSKQENTLDPKSFAVKGLDQTAPNAVESSQQNTASVPKNNDCQCDDVFVKLSDLDKPIQKPNTSMTLHEHKVLDVRMTRSIPENNWSDQNNASAPRSIEVISSFHSENALSLNRLFPHLKNEFSRSMPGILSSRTRSPMRMGVSPSPGEIEEQVSDMSEVSSVQSSMCRSVIENSTTEDTSQTSSLIGNCQSRLGQDLLRMFLEEIAPDVIVEVSGRRIKAHKCILSSRCQYFAGILSGGWVESAGNVIVLPPFSFNVVHFALCHIYSGVSTIPDSISIVELATIADMLGLEGLKEAIMFTLKAKYCHHFHRPCPVCIAGVLECFPLSSVYGLDDLYRKCLKWITKYFSKVWATKAFATLPKELLDKCYQQLVVNLTLENVVDTVYGCGLAVSMLQNSRWAETVARMCRRLVNAAAHYVAPRLEAVLRDIATLPPDPPLPAEQALDDCLAAAIEWAPPEETCRAYAFLSALIQEIRHQHFSKPDVITTAQNQTKASHDQHLLYSHLCGWRLQCEGALVRVAPRVVTTQAFKDLPADLRKRLRELGCIIYGGQVLPFSSSPLQNRKNQSSFHVQNHKTNSALGTRSIDIDHVRASFVPYASRPTAPNAPVEMLKSNNDLRDRKSRGMPPKIRTTKAQEERAKFNLSKNNQSQERIVSKSSATRMLPFENTKPRYLEPRMSKENDKKISSRKLAPRISSSESSRNSSPIQARNIRTSRIKGRQTSETQAQTMSQDSLATTSRPRTAEPSTDSLSESQNSNKYATYTKTKHTTKGSVESVKSSKCPVAVHGNNKLKTKIPVYMNQGSKSNNWESKCETQKRCPQIAKSTSNSTNNINRPKNNERKLPGSLMNATKSSSAKMVPKIVKEPSVNKHNVKQSKRSANHVSRRDENEKPPEIPVMERSGTFLKDEPTFGDKTTNIDIDQ